jgi:hypothetical protein
MQVIHLANQFLFLNLSATGRYFHKKRSPPRGLRDRSKIGYLGLVLWSGLREGFGVVFDRPAVPLTDEATPQPGGWVPLSKRDLGFAKG